MTFNVGNRPVRRYLINQVLAEMQVKYCPIHPFDEATLKTPLWMTRPKIGNMVHY
jgi:hypothetical protein